MKLSASGWCEWNFGCVQLGDRRRTNRLVQTATRMTQHPQRSIPYQMQSSAATKATYRFLDNAAVCHEAVQKPHWQNTRQAALQEQVTLCIQDTTYLDLTGRQVEAMGVIGDGRGSGVRRR